MSKKVPVQPKTAPRTPVQARGIQTRESLLDAGEKLFVQSGFHNILADDIARAAGVSVGSYYSYFKDKRALFLAVLARSSSIMMERAMTFLSAIWQDEQPDVDTLVRATMNTLIESHRAFFPIYQDAMQLALFDEEVRSALSESDRETQKLFEDMLIRVNPILPQERVHAMAYVLYNASEGIIHSLVGNPQEGIDQEQVVSEVAKMLACYALEGENQ